MGIITTVLAIGFAIGTGLQWNHKKRYLILLGVSISIFLLGSIIDGKIHFKYIINPEPNAIGLPTSEFSEIGYWQGKIEVLKDKVYFSYGRLSKPPYSPLIKNAFWQKHLSANDITTPARSEIIETNIHILLPEIKKYPFSAHAPHSLDYAYATYRHGKEMLSFIELKYQGQFPDQDSSDYLWRRLVFDHNKKSIVQMNYTLIDKLGFLTDLMVNTAVFIILLILTTVIKIVTNAKRR